MVATAGKALSVRNPFDGEVLQTFEATRLDQFSLIMERARAAAVWMAKMSRAERARILTDTATRIGSASESFARSLCKESGKPIVQARKEVARCVNTLQTSAEEAKRLCGQIIPFDSIAGNEGRFGYYVKEPLGIILAITPFNDPLNLVAHKIGPAIAAGNAVILKPSEKTPICASQLVGCLHDAGLPKECVQLLLGGKEVLQPFLESREIRMISFTGGLAAGESISRLAGLKRLSMDLGGNAANIVLKDCDLNMSIEACVSGAFWANGQNCISVQRILIESEIADKFITDYIAAVKQLSVGDPMLESTFVGPLIDETNVLRLQELVASAVHAGAVLEYGGTTEGAVFMPTVLSNVPVHHPIWLEEIFGPVVCIRPFDSFEEAIRIANQPEYSLHAAIFTNNLQRAMSAVKDLQAGGVMINDSSDFRFDGMPFGGSKLGSMGREGVRYAVEEMSQTKVACFSGQC